ncbi:zinc finger, CCHC-type containing protein [Tanacetum coccineum]|uniref:Endoglucanase n=1 Tax=Tanacetum coccineum TaxID=301880 RepID=A0ABQ5GEI1_9ASTR
MSGDDTTNTTTPKPVTPIAQYQCPKLKTTNYTVWAIQIKVILEAHDLWEAIEPKKNTQEDDKKDKATIAFLYQALTEDVILQVAGCETAKELWESLKRRHVGEEKVQQARLQSLMIGFQTLQMKEDDTVDAFTAKLNGYPLRLTELGKTLDESLLVRKLLDFTLDRFIQIVASIEQTNDLDDITLDEIIRKLKAFEERIKLRKGGQVESQENLLFAHGEHSKLSRKEGDLGIRGVDQTFQEKLATYECYKCGKLGHFRKNCKESSTTQEQSNLILEDDEPSLLMTTHETEHEEVLLNEGQIQPGKYATTDASMWYLDNGASNHMTGTKSHFRDINESVTGRIRFGDGSYVQIKGKGSILLGYRGGEFTSNEFTKYCKENGITRQLTAPYSPQQNGVVERRNITVVSTRALEDKTPYEALYNRKPNLENLRIFGCTAYAKITIPHLKKLDDRSIPMIYLGVEEGSKACRLYDPKGKRKHVSRDVRFMETKPWDWDNNVKEISTQDTFWASFVVEGVDNENPTPVNIENNDNTYQEPITDPEYKYPRLKNKRTAYTYNPNSEEEEEATISLLRNSKDQFDDTPVRGFKDLTEIYQNARIVETETLLFTEEEPRNYKEASTDKKWIEAMEIELDSINKNNIWTLTTLPTNQKAIGLKWVFKTKRDAKGKIIKYKAQLVAKGYVQEQGIDFDEVFTPVARIEIVRLILALAAYHGWQVHHLDVKSAFLHGDLKEEVYHSKEETRLVQNPNEDKFEMSDLGLLDYYLGIEVTQTGGKITIKQTRYINKILKETSMMESNDTKYNSIPVLSLVKVKNGNSVYHLLPKFNQKSQDNGPDVDVNCGDSVYTSQDLIAHAKKQHIGGSSLPSIHDHPAPISCDAGGDYFNAESPNLNLHVGAIVGGPDRNDNYGDYRSNYGEAEPATYINAPFVGLTAYFSAN